jgi:aryl-alcohol dehydrogenase-like predicted oxidoreductase
MERRRLGTSGLQVSLVGLGCNNFGGVLDLDGSRRVVHAALEAGIDFFDTADIYGNRGGSETILGELLKGHRNEVVLATKVGKQMDAAGRLKGGSRRYILSAVDGCLTRLGTDWIDLLYMHDPDPLTPIEESLRALDDLVRQGKVRYIACSNFRAWQVADAHWAARHLGCSGFVAAQDEYNLLSRGIEGDMLPCLQARGMGLVPYFPLANGLLTGKYRRDAMPAGSRLTDQAWFASYQLSEANWGKVEALAALCQREGRSMTELAMSWLAARAGVSSIIAGATRPEQVRQNAAAIDWALGPELLVEIDRITA